MKAIEIRRFGFEVDYETIIRRSKDSARIELYSQDEIIKLNIRFDEVFHRFSDSEWNDFKRFLEKNNISVKVNCWWPFWER